MNAREQNIKEIEKLFLKMSPQRQKEFAEIIHLMAEYRDFSDELKTIMEETEGSKWFEAAKELARKWREKCA